MTKLITDFYSANTQSIALKAYRSIVGYLKNKFSGEQLLTTNYKQKLITDYYNYIPKKDKLRQQLITEFYPKN